MDFDDLDDVEAVNGSGSEEEGSKLELARQAGFAPARDLDCVEGVFCFSDASCDEKASQTFIRRLTLPGTKKQEMGSLNRIVESVLIVAGGIARSPNDLHTAVQVMRTRVSHVHFVPGALELHIKSDAEHNDLPEDERRYHNSLEKAKYLLSHFSKHTGIIATPQVYDCGGEAVWVVPVVSFSSPTFDAEPDVDGPAGCSALRGSRDFTDPVWPEGLDPMSDDAANAMDGLNEWLRSQMAQEDREALEKVLRATPQERSAASTRLVTFSHFVPRPDLIPEKRLLENPGLPKMVGSTALRKRVLGIRPDVHIFGHSCFGWDATLGGIRYISAPLATLEQRLAGDTAIGNFPDFESGEPLMICQGQAWAEPHLAGWSEYYKENVREERANSSSADAKRKPRSGVAEKRSPAADLAPDWVKRCIKSEAEGYCASQGGAHSGFTYGRI